MYVRQLVRRTGATAYLSDGPALQVGSEDAFVAAMLADVPPAPELQAEIVAANRAGRPLSATR